MRDRDRANNKLGWHAMPLPATDIRTFLAISWFIRNSSLFVLLLIANCSPWSFHNDILYLGPIIVQFNYCQFDCQKCSQCFYLWCFSTFKSSVMSTRLPFAVRCRYDMLNSRCDERIIELIWHLSARDSILLKWAKLHKKWNSIVWGPDGTRNSSDAVRAFIQQSTHRWQSNNNQPSEAAA